MKWKNTTILGTDPFSNVLVKEDNGIERLVLGAGGHIVLPGQLGQEAFELLLARQGVGQVADRRHVTPQPLNVTRLGGQRLVLATDDIAQPLNGLGRIHTP